MNHIRDSYDRARFNCGLISQTVDGSIYKTYIKSNLINQNTFIVSLCINSDGAPLLTSKSTSMWPVLARILELPDKTSESFENLIVVGLWLNDEKPLYEIYLSECIERILDAVRQISNEKIGEFNINF